MMSTTTSRVQPLLDDEEEEAEGGLRRITGADTSGHRDDEALPPVGGSIGVVSHPDGYQYVVKARLAVTVHALLDVVETSNTFSATVELGLEWECVRRPMDRLRNLLARSFYPEGAARLF